jgi:hypothetical protein
MSIGTKKKDKDNKESPGGEASADYMIGAAAAGKSNTSDAASGSATGPTTADKITRNDEGTSTRKEKITSTSRSSQDEIPTESTNTTTISATTEFATSPTSVQQRERQHSVNRALDQTRDNIRRTTDEARKDIPRYTQAANEYQEQTIQAAREIADNFLESQKEIINSFQLAWLPQIETVNKVINASWVSPRHFADNYAKVVSTLADNTMVATRLVNNTIFANLEAFKTSVKNARDNAKEFSRIGVNAARSLEQTSRNTTTSGFSDKGGFFEAQQQQIPSRLNEEETQRVIEAQDHISGERREQTIRDVPRAAAVGQALKELRFPADKNKILQVLQQQSNTNPDCRKIIPLLEKIDNRQYQNVSDVTKTAGLVE